MTFKMKYSGPLWDRGCNHEFFWLLFRSDLSGGGAHVLAGLGDGSGGGNFSFYSGGIFSGLLSAPGGGIPAGWGKHALYTWAQLGMGV